MKFVNDLKAFIDDNQIYVEENILNKNLFLIKSDFWSDRIYEFYV